MTGIEFGLSVLAGCIANITSSAAEAGLRRLSRHLDLARKQGKLPEPHHIRRGISRASLMATQVSIQQLIDAGQDIFLDDIEQSTQIDGEIIERNRYFRDPQKNIAARSALQKKLDDLICDLTYSEHKLGLRDQTHINEELIRNALREAALPLSEISLEQYSSWVTSALNTSSMKPNAVSESQTIRELRHEILPDLEDAIIIQILNFGKWQPSRKKGVSAGIHASFFGKDERWIKNFAACYADEISQDTELFRMAVFLRLEKFEDALDIIKSGGETLQHEVSAFTQDTQRNFEALSCSIQNISRYSQQAAEAARLALEQLKSQMAFNGSLVFYSPGSAKQAGLHTDFKSFHFAEEEDLFTGREKVLALLHKRVLILNENTPQFQWAAICGDAGTGKSRLALHIIKRYATSWRLSGFVRKGFIRNVEQMFNSLSEISGPTLFVIDYADSLPKACCRFIERCASLAQHAPFPVRVIVLLRRPNDRFFEFIKDNEDGPIAYNTQARFTVSEDNDDSGALRLESLNSDETFELMRERISFTVSTQETKNKPISDNKDSKAELLSLLDHYDRDRRPLFALMVADAFQKGLIQNKPAMATQEEARLTLFWNYLDDQFKKRWQFALSKELQSDEDNNRVDIHINFLILSTMCRGLTDDGWQRLIDNSKLEHAVSIILPHPASVSNNRYGGTPSTLLDKDILATLSGSALSDSNSDSYPVLEPDLIGEALTLLIFDQKRGEKSFRMQNATSQRRLEHLRDFAWVAEPEGAAFFSVLVAQDYPEHASKLQWLLPSEQNSDTAGIRVKLFRNLVLVTVERFRYRAATQNDIKQIKKLIAAFRPELSDSDDIQLDFLIGLVELASHLSFMINKLVLPRDAIQPPVFTDKLGVRKLEFGLVADAPNSSVPLDEVNTRQSGDKMLYQLCSDSSAIDAAISLLHQLYDEAFEHVFSHTNIDLRHEYSKIIEKAVCSVFWKLRDKENKSGFATTPPSKEEIATRERLADRCSYELTDPGLDEGKLAITCNLVHSIIFAEDGENTSRGKKAFEVICDKASGGSFTNETSIALVLAFIGNHAHNKINFELNKPDKKDRRNLDILRETTEKLMRFAIKLPDLSEQSRDSIGNAFLDICHRIAWFNQKCDRAGTEHINGSIALFMSFIEHHGAMPAGSKALNVFSSLFAIYHQSDKSATNALSSYSNFIEHSCFDNRSLNNPNWKNLRYHLLQLAYMPSECTETVSKLIKTLIEQIGSRANRDLVDMLVNQLPDPKLIPEAVKPLVDLGCDCSEEIIAKEKRSNLNLALMSQHLLYADDDTGFMDLDAHWTTGRNKEDYIARTDIFYHLQMLIWWHGLDHAKVKQWRQRLLDVLNTENAVTEEKAGSIYHSHHQAAITTAGTFAQLEIAAGLSADDWLLLKGNHS